MNLLTRIRRTSVAGFTALTFVTAQIPFAHAQGLNSTQAESLYNQGKTLIEAKKYHEACDKFAASLKLDETPNTHLALAACFELDNRAASAWGEYLLVAQKHPDEAKRNYARDHAKALEGKMLKVHVTMALIPDDLALKIDNEAIPKESVNGDLPLDPGDHVIEATASGKHKWERHVKLAADNSPMAVTISMEDMTPDEIKAQKQQQQGGGQVIIEKPAEQKTEWSGVKTAGFVIGGVGVVVGLGAIAMGILTIVNANNATTQRNNCTNAGGIPKDSDHNIAGSPTPSDCQATDDTRQRALTFQSAGIGLGAGAGALVITGVIMILVGGNKKVTDDTTTPDKPKTDDKAASWMVAPLVSPTTAGLGVLGRF